MSDGSRYADAAFQELLQSVPEARFIERQDACASGWPDRSSVDAQGTANLQCCHHFKDHVGSTLLLLVPTKREDAFAHNHLEVSFFAPPTNESAVDPDRERAV